MSDDGQVDFSSLWEVKETGIARGNHNKTKRLNDNIL